MMMALISAKFLFLPLTTWYLLVNGGERIPLNFSFITSIRPRSGFSSAGGIPAFDIALEMINNRSDILPDYLLQYTEILDSEVYILELMHGFVIA